MMPRTLRDVAHAVGGLATGADVEIRSVVTDSRLVRPGALFVAMPGEHTDGGLFVAEAFRFGAAATLVTRRHGGAGPRGVRSIHGRRPAEAGG